MADVNKMYEEAIEVVENWRSGNKRFTLHKATPNEIHLYNIFTKALHELKNQLATIEDTQGIYMKDKK